jgi:hypothetical protein
METKDWGMAQVVQHLASMRETLSSIPNPEKKIRKEGRMNFKKE